MNEHIDVLLTSAKLATRNNPGASLAMHAASSGYNIAMIGRYCYELSLVKAGVVSYPADQIQSLQRDLIKHTVLGVMDVLGLIMCASSWNNRNTFRQNSLHGGLKR